MRSLQLHPQNRLLLHMGEGNSPYLLIYPISNTEAATSQQLQLQTYPVIC
jgi:hypothetical protein